MFFTLILENSAGDQIDMTATANQYMASQIEGLSPPPGTISTSGYAGIDVFAEGYVETCEVNNFEMLTTGQISILCPDIYWYSTESVMAYCSQILGAFTPFYQ